MKTWIITQLVALSEITGWRIPRWVRAWASPELLEQRLAEERSLTQQLEANRPETEGMPDSLRARLEVSLGTKGSRAYAPNRRSVVIAPVWVYAAAAILVVTVSLFLVVPRGNIGDVPVEAVIVQTETPSDETPLIPGTPATEDSLPKLDRQSLQSDLLLRPLVREQARLAADMSQVLQYMADSFLPHEYAERVNENLVSLEAEVAGSI